MKIDKIINELCLSNTYVLTLNDTTIIVDPGSNYSELEKFITDNNLNVIAVLLTHGHFDHCYSAYEFEKKGIPIYVSHFDEDKVLKDGDINLFFKHDFTSCKLVNTYDNEYLNLENFNIKVIETPGHTKGCVSLLIDGNLFSGDFVFKSGIGRYDLYDSDVSMVISSLRKIAKLDDNIIVYPGHGDATTIGDLKKYLNLK